MGLTNNYAKALYEWLSQFAETFREPISEGMFDEQNPKPLEYITYSNVTGNFGESVIQPITIYSQSTSYSKVMEIADAIENSIQEKGTKITKEWGYIVIYKGNPFYQDKPDEDSYIRAGYINLLIQIYQK